MRQLTFKGFLRQYVKELSYCEINDIRLLAKDAPHGNYRLVEPLVLYALSVNKDSYLRRIAEDSFLLSEAFRFEGMALDEVEHLLERESRTKVKTVPYNYVKAYEGYVLFRDKQKNQNHSKTLLRERINKLRLEKNISVYRVYTDLNLNHGCVNDYVKNGNVKGIGLHTVKKILEYLEAA